VTSQDCTVNFVFPDDTDPYEEQEEKGQTFREFTFPVLALTLNAKHHIKKHALTPSMHT